MPSGEKLCQPRGRQALWERGGTGCKAEEMFDGREAVGVPEASEGLRVPTKRALWEEGGTAKRTSPPLVGAEVEHVSTRVEEEQGSVWRPCRQARRSGADFATAWRAGLPKKMENGKLTMIGLPQSQQALWERGGNARKAKLFPQSGKTSKKGEFRRGGEDGYENCYSQPNAGAGAYCI